MDYPFAFEPFDDEIQDEIRKCTTIKKNLGRYMVSTLVVHFAKGRGSVKAMKMRLVWKNSVFEILSKNIQTTYKCH